VLDELDKRIIESIQRNGRIPLSRISESVGISHVAIKRRLDKLRENGWISISSGLNGEKLDLKLAMVTAEVENYSILNKLLNQFEKCPRIVYMSSFGGSKIVAIILGENLSTLESVLGTCFLRVRKGVRGSTVDIGSLPKYPKFLPIRIVGKKTKRKTPCGGIECRKCKRFLEEECLGCPTTRYYRGRL